MIVKTSNDCSTFSVAWRERVVFHIERTFPWCLNQSNSRRVFLCCYFFIWRSISCINAPYASFSKNEQDYSPFYQRSWILHNECYRIIWPLLLLILQFPLFRERRKDATEGQELRYFWNNPTQKIPCFVNLDYRDVCKIILSIFWNYGFLICHWNIGGNILIYHRSNIKHHSPDGDFSPRYRIFSQTRKYVLLNISRHRLLANNQWLSIKICYV